MPEATLDQDPGPEADGGDDQVELVVPTTPDLLRLARVTASGLASRLGFTYDGVEDLRLAIDELCHAVVGRGSAGGTLTVRYRMEGDSIVIEGTAKFGPGAKVRIPRLNEFSQQILDTLVDEHQLTTDVPGFRLVKRKA